VVALVVLERDAQVMGTLRAGSVARVLGWTSVVLIVACVAALGVSAMTR